MVGAALFGDDISRLSVVMVPRIMATREMIGNCKESIIIHIDDRIMYYYGTLGIIYGGVTVVTAIVV